MKKRKVCLLVNPFAHHGKGIKKLKKVERVLSSLPISFHTLVPSSLEEAERFAIHAMEEEECLAIMGGDGSIRSMVEIVKKYNGVLAIIPTGRGNDLARMLNISSDPIQACQALAYGQEIKIDIGQVNEHLFLGICSLGIDSIANKIANKTVIIKNRAAYLYAGLRTLLRWSPVRFEVSIDGKEFEHEGYSVAVANSRCYAGGMYLAPHASIQDGLLDVVFIGNISKTRILLNMPRVFKGTHTNELGFKMLRGSEININADKQFTLCADGDMLVAPPAHIQVLKQSLRVLI